ncbi:hypothetical protein Tco_0796146 [Tanacetum coccineum]
MADQRTMAKLLRAPTEGYVEAIVVPPILAEHFELKHSLINMMTSDQFFGLEKDNPHDHIRWFNKITSIIKYKDVPNSAIKLMLFLFSLAGAARRWLEKEPPSDKIFNPGILIHENLFEVTNCATPDKNVKKISYASLILEDFNPPLYELPFHKEVPGLGDLLSFSSKNKEKVFNSGIITSKRVHTSLLLELSHRDTKTFKVIKILESLIEIFPCSYGEDIRVLDVPCLHFYPP